jgi:acetone carboxylase gamma subunit
VAGRIGVALLLTDEQQVQCACGHALGDARANWRSGCVRRRVEELPRGVVVHASLELVQYLCPACGRQHGVEVAERGSPPLEDFRLNVSVSLRQRT